MKKHLLGTTALAAAAGLVALAAPTSADAAERLKLGVAGYFQAYYAFVDQKQTGTGEPAESRREWDLFREGEIHFTGEVPLDNGMRIGVHVELEAETCADDIDESYLYFQGSFGKIIVGSENSAAYLLSVGAPTVDANFDGADPNYRIFQVGGNRAAATQQYAPTMSGDSEKITYLSPRFAGFQVGVSYTGDNSEEATVGQVKARGGSFAGMPTDDDIGEQQDIIEVGVNYEQKFNDFGILAGATYGWGSLEDRGSCAAVPPGPGGVPPGVPASCNFDDQEQWSVGLNVTFAGFTIGAGYFWDNAGIRSNGDREAIAAGINYRIGPLLLGASYLHLTQEQGTGATAGGSRDDEIDRYLVGARYTFHPGMEARASVHYYDLDGANNTATGANDRNDAFAVVGGIVVSF